MSDATMEPVARSWRVFLTPGGLRFLFWTWPAFLLIQTRPAWLARKALGAYRVLLTRLRVAPDLIRVVEDSDEYLLGVAEPRTAIAIMQQRMAGTSDPRFLELHYMHVAMLYEDLHEYETAIAYWERARNLPPTWSAEFDAHLLARLQRLKQAQ